MQWFILTFSKQVLNSGLMKLVDDLNILLVSPPRQLNIPVGDCTLTVTSRGGEAVTFLSL